ncbi:MAG: hypothetical protein ABSB30_09750 [Terracidiphilus sp.]
MHLQKRAASRQRRLQFIGTIERARQSKVLTYVTASRPPFGAQIGMDAIRIFRDQLGTLGKVKQLDLLLITRGGDTLVPLRLMSLLREFASRVSVLVPYMAHSSGTLIALGADEIVMGAMGELGPVDPSVANQFNPILEADDQPGPANSVKPRPRIPISVEDVISYITFAKEDAGLDTEGMAQAHTALTANVHPLAIGNILRTHKLIRHLAKKLLAMHMGDGEQEKIGSIVKSLTENLYAHNYVITRTEAPQLGLKFASPTADVEDAMWQLYLEYEAALGFDVPVNMLQELGSLHQKYMCFDFAVIESQVGGSVNCLTGMASKSGTDAAFNVETQGWQSL